MTRRRYTFPRRADGRRHDHRQSIWLIAGGSIVWCYRCGAWAHNLPGQPWHRTTGPDGENPAMIDFDKP